MHKVRIEPGGLPTLRKGANRGVNKIRQTDPNHPILNDASFTPNTVKQAAQVFKTSTFARDPGMFMATLHARMQDYMTEQAIRYYDVKPDKGIFRINAVLKAIQSVLLLDFNPMYVANNTINNQVTVMADHVAGLMGSEQMDVFLTQFGSLARKADEGYGMSGYDTSIHAYEAFKSMEEAYQAGMASGGMRKAINNAIEWSDAER